MKKETADITSLRNGILSGLVRIDADQLIAPDGIVFPVENCAQIVFVREFYPIFYKYFKESVFPDTTFPGMICRGPPGVGKVNIQKFLHVISPTLTS